MPDYAFMNECLYEGKAKEVEQMTKDTLAEGRSVKEVLEEGLIAGISAWVPTFAPVQEQVDHADALDWDQKIVTNLRGILDRHAASFAKAHAIGVMIVAGIDASSCGVAHGLGLFYEMELMERAGQPAIAVINTATGVGAGRLGYKEKFGRLEPGWFNRFILPRHSPLATVSILRKPKVVIFDGEHYESELNSDGRGL